MRILNITKFVKVNSCGQIAPYLVSTSMTFNKKNSETFCSSVSFVCPFHQYSKTTITQNGERKMFPTIPP